MKEEIIRENGPVAETETMDNTLESVSNNGGGQVNLSLDGILSKERHNILVRIGGDDVHPMVREGQDQVHMSTRGQPVAPVRADST